MPVNWLVYSPSTIPSGRYELGFDTGDFKEGRQSLRFAVEDCSADGGWMSPGIAQELAVEPGEYLVRFWVKSDGADYVVTAGGVTAKTGATSAIDTARGGTEGWRLVEQRLSLEPKYDRLRFELSVRSPGTLWIDDVQIEPVLPL